ncbi:serine hydrolase domain-containing protein [Herbiconiux sp. P17]|uniref:serine hydrolase domain-containing protein n=1 Tax=Herbiconiux wuyangfengii TaxID=3342794 RepID=UPI0035BA6975
MTTSQFVRSVVVVGAVALLVAGCSSSPAQSTTTTPPATAEPAAAADATCVVDPSEVVARTQPLPTTPMPDSLASTLDSAAQSGFDTAAAPGAIVAVQSPEGLFLKAYGEADPTTGAPMTTDMFQRIGSLSKTFTGTLLMQLVADGQVSLDDPVSEYLDGVPRGDAITLQMLADMTAGLASYTKDDGFQKIMFDDPHLVHDADETLAFAFTLPASFDPGEGYEYSNTDTLVLGKVIEKVTGKPFSTVLQENILTPLGLTHTSFPDGSADFPSPHPQGYTLQGNDSDPANPTDATDWNPSWGWAAGEMISSASDLLTFGRAVATGDGLVPADSQIVRLESFQPAEAGYGIGWGCQSGWVGHGGELPGFNTQMFYDTNSDTTVITMVNSDIASGDCESDVLDDNPTDLPCSSPAKRILTSVTEALGNPFVQNK